MNLTKKLLYTALLTGVIFNLSGCSYKTLDPEELTKANEISINEKSYIPEYDGLDAYLLSDEELVLGTKEHWYIHNEKLYLFVDADTKEKWFTNMDLMMKLNETQWALLNVPTEEEEFEDMTDAFMNGTSN